MVSITLLNKLKNLIPICGITSKTTTNNMELDLNVSVSLLDHKQKCTRSNITRRNGKMNKFIDL